MPAEENKKENYELDFLDHMSHELKTPLNAIIGLLEIASAQQDNSLFVNECLTKARISSQLLLSVINDFLNTTKKDESCTQKVTPFKIKDLLEEILAMLKPFVQQINFDLSISYDAQKKYYYADKEHLEQMISTLLINTYRNCSDIEKIQMQFILINENETNDAFVFKIFDPGNKTIKEAVLKLELASIEPEEKKNDFNKGITFSLKNKRVLLVEDNEMNAMIAESILQTRGMIVDLAQNGKSGVDMFSNSSLYYYDVILMDIYMPVMNGYQATKEIRAIDRPDAAKIPIFAISANAFKDDIKKAHSSGMNEHLSKPINSKLLFKTLEHYLIEKPCL